MTEPLSKEQIDAIRARADAASPAPWHTIGFPWAESEDADTWVKSGSNDPHISTFVCDCLGMIEPDDEFEPNDFRPRENAEFIACARQDVPALLAHIDVQTEMIARLSNELAGTHEHLQDIIDGNQTGSNDPIFNYARLQYDLVKIRELDLRVVQAARAFLSE